MPLADSSGNVTVKSVDTGRVLSVSKEAQGGIRVVVRHTGSITAEYGHLSGTRLSADDWVQSGDTVGWMQETENQAAPLLFFAIMKDKTYIDPAEVVSFDYGRLTAGREIIIALAGPLQNGIMIVMALVLQYAGGGSSAFLAYFIQANAIIALFNLLPVLPLDGGKILQAAFSTLLPYYYTLLWSGRVSITASMLVICYALLPLMTGGGLRLNLLMIGAFLLYSNVTDQRNLPYRFVAFLMNREAAYERHLRSGSAARPIVAFSAKPLDDILRLFKRNQYHFIYVMNDDKNVVAVVPEQRLISSYFGM
ncbi:Stage IV sporulation protein FB [compost metagenome]